MNINLLKSKAKHSLAGLTLACTTFAPCAMAQTQSNEKEDDNKKTYVAETATQDSVVSKKSTYLGFGIRNVLGVNTTGKEVNVLDRATLEAEAGFDKNKWHGNVSAEGTFELRNKDVSGRLTQMKVDLGKKIFSRSDIGISVGREYTEKDLFFGPTRFIDYNVANIYQDYYGNLSDKLTLVYKTDKGLSIELGAIEQADSSFYLVPNLPKSNFFGKIAFDTKSNKNIQFAGSGAIELGSNAKKFMGDFSVNGSNFGVMIGCQYDIANEYFGMCASGNYISKRNFRYILSLAKYYHIYIVQAGVEKKNLMFFVNVNTAKNYTTVNAGLSWVLDYKHKVR